MLSVNGLRCAVGSPEVLLQPRDAAEGFYQSFFSEGLQWVEETQRSEFTFDCSQVLFICSGGKKVLLGILESVVLGTHLP